MVADKNFVYLLPKSILMFFKDSLAHFEETKTRFLSLYIQKDPKILTMSHRVVVLLIYCQESQK